MRITALFTLFVLFASATSAEEVVLDNYSWGGTFQPADWANTFTDSDGNANAAGKEGKVALVRWATKWSGLPSTGEADDYSRFKTYQVDVKVDEGQPVEEGSNFYFQLLNEVDEGYSYWELFVPQSKVKADGKWYRIKFPIRDMVAGHGEGGDAPTNFETIFGITCGMTFDDTGSEFKFKEARFDNVTLSTEPVDAIEVEPSPKTVNPPSK